MVPPHMVLATEPLVPHTWFWGLTLSMVPLHVVQAVQPWFSHGWFWRLYYGSPTYGFGSWTSQRLVEYMFPHMWFWWLYEYILYKLQSSQYILYLSIRTALWHLSNLYQNINCFKNQFLLSHLVYSIVGIIQIKKTSSLVICLKTAAPWAL